MNRVVLTPEFRQEFRDIYNYIAKSLLAPETAAKQVSRILDRVESLAELPNRFPLTDKEPWRTRGLRKTIIDNFIVFYVVNEEAEEVVVFHVFYGGSDIGRILSNDLIK